MNFSTDTLGSNKYLKVQVTAKEELGLDHQREGHSDVIIPINTSNDRLSVYSANVTFDGTTPGTPPAPDAPPSLHLPDNFADHERCLDKDTKPKGICEVAKDEIIAVAINNKTTGGNNRYKAACEGRKLHSINTYRSDYV